MNTGVADPNSVGTLNGVTYTGTGSARFIRGDGSAIQMGEGNDVLTNYGTIIGNTGRAVNMEGGNDTVNIMKGSRIVGLVDGGVGTDTLNYNKAGLTDAKRAALQAGQTVNIGGTLYTSFEVITGTSSSFASFASAGSARRRLAVRQSAGQRHQQFGGQPARQRCQLGRCRRGAGAAHARGLSGPRPHDHE